MISRRQFLKVSALTAGSLALPSIKWLSDAPKAYAFSQSDNLKKFIQPLRRVGTDIPVAQPDMANPGWWQPGVTHYTINIVQFEDQLHPDLPNPTRLWGFSQNGNTRHLAGVIAAQHGVPVQVTFRNHLPPKHILPVDTSLPGAELAQNRTSIHLHGGFVPWVSDGGPFAWWDPEGNRGPSFVNVLNPSLANNEAENYYPNNQGARLVWYHEHSLGITRLGAYAGIASAYVISDEYEEHLTSAHHLPGPLDPRTIYLVFQDKTFVSKQIEDMDPTWFNVVPNSRPGDLWYPHVYDPNRWELDSMAKKQPPDPSVVPEAFGDTILVNGSVYPFLEVEQRQYRFSLLNACNARFLNPRLVFAKGNGTSSSAEPNPDRLGPAFIQFGTEGGFLPHPVMLNGPKQPFLLLGPAERADLIVDFRDVPEGTIFILYNDAAAPFPSGDMVNDYYPGNPDTPMSIPGFGPNTRTLLQIRVKARTGAKDQPVTLPQTLNPIDSFLVKQHSGRPTPIPKGILTRYLTLNETSDDFGRLIQMLGTNRRVKPGEKPPEFGRPYMADPTEVVSAGSMEVWEIINLTGDTHPIHFHLVNVQVLSRQDFNVDTYDGGKPDYLGEEVAPDDNELGWKETVRMNPGQVTRVLMKFDLPSVPFNIPESPRTGGSEYVWHCHILEHEEHDMMRPLIVK